MAKGITPDDEKKQDAYVANRLSGMPKKQAAIQAGYAPTTTIHNIERPGGAVENKLTKALADGGINEKFITDRFKQVFEEAPTMGKSGDYGAVVKALYTLTSLMGYGKRSDPAVAVQINNSTSGASENIDIKRAKELIGRFEECIGIIEAERSKRESSGLHEGDNHAGAVDATAHNGVGDVIADAQEVDSGGEPGPR